MRSRELRERLRDAPLPGAHEAEERSWEVVRAAFEERERLPRAPAPRGRFVLVMATAVVLLAGLLSPAGAAVRDWIRDAVEPGQAPLTELPAPGRLLVESEQGPWIVQEDGSQRLLGAYQDATWSPSGLYVAVTRGRQLTAVDPLGEARWSIAQRRPVSEPRWAPSGFRIAYLSGGSLRVIAGDGTGDRLLERDVAAVAPAWSPFTPSRPEAKLTGVGTHVLAFARRDGTVTVIDVDSGRDWDVALPDVPRQLEWSPDGERLIALTDSSIRVLSRTGATRLDLPQPQRAVAEVAAVSPNGERIAVVRERPGAHRSELALIRIEGTEAPRERTLYDGFGRFSEVVWSPDGRWLLLAWRDEDQWLFMRPRPQEKLIARTNVVSDISHQFDPGGSGTPAFPRVSGWCCAP